MKITIQKSKIEMIEGPFQEGNDFKLRIYLPNPTTISVKGSKESVGELYKSLIGDNDPWLVFETDTYNKLL